MNICPINSINTTNFGMKFSSKANDLFSANEKNDMKNIVSDDYTLDIKYYKNGENALVLSNDKDENVIPVYCQYINKYTGKTPHINQIIFSLEAAKRLYNLK